MEPLVELRDVSFGYGAAHTLHDINIHMHPGQFAAMVGPNGAGKTTLLKLIVGILSPTHGEVRIDGKVLNGGSTPQVGYVPQLETVDWNFPVTVEQVALMGCARKAGLLPWPSREEKDRLHDVLERLEIADLAGRHIRDLSGGQQQRVFLARALIAEPDLLVLDEPTSGVDVRTVESVIHMLADLNQQGITILMTTHDLNLAAAHVPWMICLNEHVIAQGAPEEVLTEDILSETYQSEMMVIEYEGHRFVQQRPHGHTLNEVLPDPVPGGMVGNGHVVVDSGVRS